MIHLTNSACYMVFANRQQTLLSVVYVNSCNSRAPQLVFTYPGYVPDTEGINFISKIYLVAAQLNCIYFFVSIITMISCYELY